MKSEYFVLLPNDICCSLQSFAAIALKSQKFMTENLFQQNALVLIIYGATLIMITYSRFRCRVKEKYLLVNLLEANPS